MWFALEFQDRLCPTSTTLNVCPIGAPVMVCPATVTWHAGYGMVTLVTSFVCIPAVERTFFGGNAIGNEPLKIVPADVHVSAVACGKLTASDLTPCGSRTTARTVSGL